LAYNPTTLLIGSKNLKSVSSPATTFLFKKYFGILFLNLNTVASLIPLSIAFFICCLYQALAATDFGEYDDNNVWQPKEFEGSYTTSGVSFDFSEQQLYAGGTREALFDGSTSTGCNFQKTSASSSSTVPSNTKRIKVTFPTAKTGVTKLRIYGGGNTSSTNKVWYNDDESTMITNNDPVGWKTVYTGSAITINSISFGTSDGGCNLRAIEINDVVLTDAVEQGINSFHLRLSATTAAPLRLERIVVGITMIGRLITSPVQVEMLTMPQW
jgi:hypothetical protein